MPIIDLLDSTFHKYDNTISGLTADKTKLAIDEVQGNLDTHEALTTEHIDWTLTGAGTIHSDNYIENVPTVLSNGTASTTVVNITSDGATDDLVLTAPSTTKSGIMTAAIYDEHVINTTHSASSHAPSTAEQNVQSDWTETNTGLDSYILNKENIEYTSPIPVITATVGGLFDDADAVKFAAITGTNTGDEVHEFAAEVNFPATGDSGHIYVDLTTKTIHRWTGTVYEELSVGAVPENSTITLTAGTGLSTGGTFTLNQVADKEITLDLDIAGATLGGVLTGTDISIDASGNVSVNTLNQDTTGTATKVVVTANETTNISYPVVLHDESNNLLDTQTLKFNPSTDILTTTGISTTGDVSVGGDLIVTGTTSTLNVTDLQVADKSISLAYIDGTSESDASAEAGGITLHAATDKTILWKAVDNSWEFSTNIKENGTLLSAKYAALAGLSTQNFAANNLTLAGNITLSTVGATVDGVDLDKVLIDADFTAQTSGFLVKSSDGVYTVDNASYQPAGTYDNYSSWNITDDDNTPTTAISSGGTLQIKGGTALTSTLVGSVLTIDGISETYTAHEGITEWVVPAPSARQYITDLTIDGNGHVTGGSVATETVVDTWRGIDDIPVNGEIAQSITSNWAFDHNAGTGNLKHVPAIGTAGQFLAYNGVWAVPVDTNTEYTAGTGITLNTLQFDLDVAQATIIGGVQGSADVTIDGSGNMTNTAAAADFLVNGDLNLTNSSLQDETGSTAAVTSTSIASFNGAVFNSGKFLIQVKDTITGEFQSSELLVVHNGTVTSNTEYGVVYTSSLLASFDTSYDAGTININATALSSNSTTYKISKNLIEA